MRKIGIIAAVLLSGVGGWLGFQGLTSQTDAAAPTFDYDGATLDQRVAWLGVHAPRMQAMLERSLPRGKTENDLSMAVAQMRVDGQRRSIEAIIAVNGPFGIDRKAVPAAKHALKTQICPSYAVSELGKNRVKVLHSFVRPDGTEDLSLVISPMACEGYLEG